MPTYYNKGGVRIEIRLRENEHNVPHVHAIYAVRFKDEDIKYSIRTF